MLLRVTLATHEVSEVGVPYALQGLDDESLSDLSWVDTALGLHGFAWWPVVHVQEATPDGYTPLGIEYRADPDRRIILSTATFRPFSDDERADMAAGQLKGAQTALDSVVTAWLDHKARERNYDNIVSASSYAGAPNPFQAESVAYLVWRASCWQTCYRIMTDVLAGTRAVPSNDELLAELPELVLP